MKRMSMAQKHAPHGFTQFELTNYLLNNLSQFNITPTAKLVLLELSAHYNPNNPDMFPKQKTLANKIGVSERSVVRAVQELFKAGLIIIECKYTNRYKFTSRIVEQQPLYQKNFCADNLSQDLSKNVTKQSDNLTQHEQTKEPIKKPLSIGDYSKLKQYAEQRGAKNLQAYVNALIKNGNAQTILKEINAGERKSKESEKETQNFIHQSIEDAKTAVPPSKLWFELKQKTMRKIEEQRKNTHL